MNNKKQVGDIGEKLARKHLEALGYIFITANWRCKAGEVDLIMQQGPIRVFTEVRLRAPTTFGAGFETVAWQKQQKLIRTAKLYQQKEEYWGNIRFDVVSITFQPDKEPVIEHIEDAFTM